MATLKFLKQKPVRRRYIKKYGNSKWSSFVGKQSAAAVKALTKKTTVHKLTADLTDIILGEEAFDLSKKNMLIELGFDGEKFQVKPADESEREAEKASVPTVRRKFDPRGIGLQIVEKAKEAEGGAWSGNKLNEQFNLSPATLHRRRKEHRIIFWRDARHDFFYPKWQFTESGALRPGIEEILNTFNSSDEWRIMRYFLSTRHQLGEKRPLDLLRAGRVEEVIAHAKANAEEGSW